MQPELKLLWKKNVTWVFRVEVALFVKNVPLYTENCKKIHTSCEQ